MIRLILPIRGVSDREGRVIQESCSVIRTELVTEEIYVVTFESDRIGESVLPGQFVNVRSWDGSDPLLRRPFSVYTVAPGGEVSILFNIVGKGTRLLSRLKQGDRIDVLGPLGTPFMMNPSGVKLAILVAGGLGVAPMPILASAMNQLKIPVLTYLGARSKGWLVTASLRNLKVATDDGSAGFEGTVVDLLARDLPSVESDGIALFGCGPNPMLRALSEFAAAKGIRCEISLEGPMGCGFGICQGCPVPLRSEPGKYLLMCREGPVFDSTLVKV